MSYIRKTNQYDQNPARVKNLRIPLKNKLSDHFKDDLLLANDNPFSEELTPWSGHAKLEASVNLLKMEAEKNFNLSKNLNQHLRQALAQQIVSIDSLQYTNLAFPEIDNHQKQQESNSHFCPKLKVNSHQVFVSKSVKSPVKRFLLTKKLSDSEKNVKKIANLTMQWDEDIVYNPQRKYFQEQNLKRKILREFPYTRNENRMNLQNSAMKQIKSEGKVFKLEFKNNKIHKKQISIFQFKKKQNSLQIDKSKNQNEHERELREFLTINRTNKSNQEQGCSNKISSQNRNVLQSSNFRTVSPEFEKRGVNSNKFRSDKWKFRTSLKTKRQISPQKNVLCLPAKVDIYQNKRNHRAQIQLQKEKDIVNKITLELWRDSRQLNSLPLQIFTRTSPHFFKKTID